MLRPEEIARPSPTGLLRSSFHLPSHLQEVSNMTTRANSQFPRPDFHRQDKQPYGLRATVREWLRTLSAQPPIAERQHRNVARGHAYFAGICGSSFVVLVANYTLKTLF